MPKSETSVKQSEPLTDTESESRSETGKSSSKSDDRTLEQIMAENERKAAEISELRKELNELKEDKEERLAELQEKETLTRAEREEIGTLEEQIRVIENEPKAKAWLEVNKRESKKVSREEADTLDLEYAMDWLEEVADREKIDFDKFKKEIFAIVKDRWVGQRATKKAKLAFKEWKEKQEIQKERDDARKKNSEQFAEVGGKTARAMSKKEILDDARSTGSYQDLLKGIASVQDETTKR